MKSSRKSDENMSEPSLSRPSPWMKLSSFVAALRPWSFSTSIVPVLFGSLLVYKSTGEFSILIFLTTALTAISVHAAGNLVNTYYDFIKGIDSMKSEDRTLVDHILTKDEVVTLGASLYGLGCVGFVVLVILSPAKMEHLAIIYFGGLSSSFLYTGGIGLKYIALGDVAVLTIFGPITLLYAFVAQSGHVQWGALCYAVPLALNTEAILHSNNTRDMESDRRAGIVTLAIVLGSCMSHFLLAIFLFTPYIMITVLGVKTTLWLLLPDVTMPYAFRLEREFRTVSKTETPKKIARLNLYFGVLYIVAVFLSPANKLPFLTSVIS